MDSTLLILVLFLPLLGALGLLVLRTGSNADNVRRFALGVTLTDLILGVWLFAGFDGASGGFEAAWSVEWFVLPEFFGSGAPVTVHLAFAMDGISLLLVTLTLVLVPVVVLASYGHIQHRVKEYLFWLLFMQTGMLGVFLATDIVTFYVFWELGLVPLYFIIGIWGGERRRYATVKFFIYTVAGSLPMLLGTIALIQTTGTSDLVSMLDPASGAIATLEASGRDMWMFVAFFVAFAIKVPIVPFHTWLPDAHVEAPTGGSVILAGVLLKLGTYGILRFCVSLFPAAAQEAALPIMVIGVVGIIYGALLAYAQRDLKKLIAYSSVSHLGFVIVGIFALNLAGLRGGLLQMVNHGLSTGALFLAVGVLYERRHTREIGEFGGIAKVMPFYAFALLFVTLSSIGLPGLNGFVGEFLVLFGSFDRNVWIGALAATGVILGAVYMLGMIREVLFGKVTREPNRKLSDCSLREKWLFAPLMILMLWIGLYPKFFFDRIDPALERVYQRVEGSQEPPAVAQIALAPAEESKPAEEGVSHAR